MRRRSVFLAAFLAILAASVVIVVSGLAAEGSSALPEPPAGATAQAAIASGDGPSSSVVLITRDAVASTKALAAVALGMLGLGLASVVVGARRRAPERADVHRPA